MIRINLIGGEIRAKKRSEGGQKTVFVGLGAIAAAAAAVFFFVHTPLKGKVAEQVEANKKQEAANKKLEEDTKELKSLKAEKEADEARWASIEQLDKARAVPAWLLWEISNILTRGRQPQITDEMKEEIKSNLNRPWQEGWDAKHVWIISFKETAGKFELEGGAQTDSDATQLALRMQASMFFSNVSPKGGVEEVDKESNLPFYRFTITGTVMY